MYSRSNWWCKVAAVGIAASLVGAIQGTASDVAPLRAAIHEIDANVTEDRYVSQALVRNGEGGETFIEFNVYGSDSDGSERWLIQYSREGVDGDLVKAVYVDGVFVFKLAFHEAGDSALYTLETEADTVSLLASHEKQGDLSYLQLYATIQDEFHAAVEVATHIWPWIIPPHIVNCLTTCNDVINPPTKGEGGQPVEINCNGDGLSWTESIACCRYQADFDHCMMVCNCQHVHSDNPPAAATCVQEARDAKIAAYSQCWHTHSEQWLEELKEDGLLPDSW